MAMSFGAHGPAFSRTSLYVGDLDVSVTEPQLYDLFKEFSPISVKVCLDRYSGTSLGYGYVNFRNPHHAYNAMKELKFTPINRRPIRIMFQRRDPEILRSGNANIFIKNLHPSIQNLELYETFSHFGNIISCKVVMDFNGKSRGYGFVQYEKEQEANDAIEKLNGMLLNERKVYVGLFIPHEKRERLVGPPKFTNIYVKNLSDSFTNDDLRNVFKECGLITSAVVMTDDNGKSRCFGFVNFVNTKDAASAVERFNRCTNYDKVWYVGRAQSKSERSEKLKQERRKRYPQARGSNLYMKNLDSTYNDEHLIQIFSKYGNITSSKVMLDAHGRSRGFGFVAFSSPEEANRVLIEMNGKMIGNKPLYVAIAEQKEERAERMKFYFAHARAPSVASPVIPLIHSHGNTSKLPSNTLMPFNIQRQGQRSQSVRMHHLPQLLQNNVYYGFDYMTNARPQGLMRPLMASPLELGTTPTAASM